MEDKNVTIHDDKIYIGGNRFEKDKFYEALEKALRNKKKDTRLLGFKLYNILEGGNYSIGLLPVPKRRRIHNTNQIEEYPYPSIGMVLCKPMLNEIQIYMSRDSMRILRKSDSHYIQRNIHSPNLIDYPDIWSIEDDYLVLNEALRIYSSEFGETLNMIIEDDDFTESSRVSRMIDTEDGEYNLIKDYDSGYPCSICGDLGKRVFEMSSDFETLSDNNTLLPHSILCFECLPEFMGTYLDYDSEEVESKIVSKFI